MKVEVVEPKVERDVVITLKESQAREIGKFFGGMSEVNRRVCYNNYDDAVVYRFGADLANKLNRCKK